MDLFYFTPTRTDCGDCDVHHPYLWIQHGPMDMDEDMERVQPRPVLWIKIWISREEGPLDRLFACALRMWIMDLEYYQCRHDEDSRLCCRQPREKLSAHRSDLTREPWSSCAGLNSGFFASPREFPIRTTEVFLSCLLIYAIIDISASFNCTSESWPFASPSL
jgi:hypothetical protein